MRWSYLILLFFTILTFGCRQGGKDNADNCKYGRPTPIFSSNPAIQTHRFTASENEAEEQVLFKDSTRLTVIQSGCNEIRQQFQFELQGSYQEETPSFWIQKTIERLRSLGSMGPDYQAFNAWAQSIEAQQNELKLAESVALEPGFFVTIDGIVGAGNATLVLTLSNAPQ